ncbi:MAG: hypothetical protein V4625_13245 [Pseudomonadota bacterium]
MAQQEDGLIESAVPLFDVVVRVPSGGRLDDIARLAAEVPELPPERVERLMKALRNSPNAKVGAAVTLERANQERTNFTKAGLLVDVTPLLSVAAVTRGSYDGLESCPACGKRITVTPTRQCPACNVYVDKITDEYLLKKKIMDQERGALEFQQARSAKNAEKSARDSVEAAMRAKIRAELEKEFGVSGNRKVKGAVKGFAIVSLVAVAFVGGQSYTPEGFKLPWSKSSAPAGASGMSADSLQKQSDKAVAAGAAGAAEAAGADGAAAATGDADIDDPLIQAAGGKRIGAKGISIEQAVAAASTLGKAVGNTTVDRAMSGAGVGPGGPGAAGGARAAGPGAAGAAAAGAGGAAGGEAAASVPKQTKQVLTAEFATLLAELGQATRSREVLKALAATVDPAADTEESRALRSASLRAQAWNIQKLEGSQARAAADDLKAKTLAVTSPVERTQLLGNVAVILSRLPQLSPEIPRAFLSLGADALKSISAPQNSISLGDLAVSMAQVFSNETTARAKSGAWNKAQASAAQVQDLIKQAPDAWAQSRLHAVDHQIQLQLGHSDKAGQSLAAALAPVTKSGTPMDQAIQLRALARLSDGAVEESFQAATSSVQAQLESKSGMEKAQALTQLSLLYASAGLPAKASQLRQMAQNTPGLSAADSTLINTDLIVRSDLATARVLQSLGRYAEAEALLQRVGGYLF